ncbi:hypothetical protein [Gemmatimonas sp.]
MPDAARRRDKTGTDKRSARMSDYLLPVVSRRFAEENEEKGLEISV